MKMPNLLTEGNTITNVEQFKAYLSEVEMTDNFKSYLESLLNHLNKRHIRLYILKAYKFNIF